MSTEPWASSTARGTKVLGRDHLEGVLLARELLLEHGGDLGIDLRERGVEEVGGKIGHGWWLLGTVGAGVPRRAAVLRR